MNVIAKISCYFLRSVVTLKLRKEYLNTLIYNIPALFWVKTEQYDISNAIPRHHTKFQKNSPFFGAPCIHIIIKLSKLKPGLSTFYAFHPGNGQGLCYSPGTCMGCCAKTE